ncbi:hypothetical protein EO238_27055, partial [Citrobacter sp. AAK_AS5]
MNDELRRLSDLKNKFLGVAAHDLRGPIGLIKMVADSLLLGGEKIPQDARKKFLTDISQQSDYMLGLLNDLLDVSAIESR